AESRASRAWAVQEIIKNEHQINQLLGRVYQPIQESAPSLLSKELFWTQKAGPFVKWFINRVAIRQEALDMKNNFAELDASRLSFLPAVAIRLYMGLQSFSFDKLFHVDE